MGPPRERAQSAQPVAALLTVLEDAFGVHFELWRYESEWVCAPPFRHSMEAAQPPQVSFVEQLRDCLQSDQPVVTPLAPETFQVLIPVAHGDSDWSVAHGVVTAGDGDMLARHAETALKVIRQKRELDSQAQSINEYVEQVTQNFEELSWLRGLAQQVELMDASTSLKMLAESVLPQLRVNLRADSLLLLAPDSSPPDQLTRESATAFRVESACGQTGLTAEQLRDLVGHSDEGHRSRPRVSNTGDTRSCETSSSIRSSVAVDLSRNDRHYGWLVAVNKQGPAEANPSLSTGIGQFGTAEASLMETAGVILATAARNSELLAEQESLLLGTVRALINAIDAKDPYTFGHSERVGQFARRIAQQMDLDDEFCQVVYLSGLLHDVGKIGVPDRILQKVNKLTDEEFVQIRRHPELGFEILQHVKPLEAALPGVLHHHEAVDGSGYPAGLAGEQIPLIARILAVADSYDAMTSTRSYRPAMSSETAESILSSRAGIQWDTGVVSAFFAARTDLQELRQKRDAPPLHVWDVCLSQTLAPSKSAKETTADPQPADFDLEMEMAL